MTTVKKSRKTYGKRDNASMDNCFLFESVEIKQEIDIKQEADDLDIGSTQFQPPDIYYNNLLRVKAEPSSDGASTSNTNPAFLEAHENTYLHISPNMMTDHPCTIELELPEYRKFSESYLFECTICGQNFGHNCKLERHMMTHTGDMPYACSECDYKTPNLGHLKCHMTRHTDEKSFECSLCSKTYKYDTSLKKHMKNSHPKKRDYKTAIFGHLNTHMKCHAGEDVSKCTTCREIYKY